MKKKVGLIALLLPLWLLMAPAYSQDRSSSCSVDDKTANLDFTLMDMNGDELQLSDLKGKVILLDFWATWCAPCRIEIPGFIELFDSYEDRGLVVLGISVDDSVESLLLYAEEMEMDYPILIGDQRDDVKDAYGPLYGFPTTFLINRDGNICHQHIGFSPKEQFESEILQLL
jgi:peroxiredoxin